MWVWWALPCVSVQQQPQSGHTALDTTFFNRRSGSSNIRQRSGNTVQMLKVTILTDVDSLAVLDVHITARWRHDTKTGPQVVRVLADDLQSVASNNGFQDWHTECEIDALDVEYLVHYRGTSPKAIMNNALNQANCCSQRWMDENSHSITKRSFGDAVRALGWYRQFRDIVLVSVLINI